MSPIIVECFFTIYLAGQLLLTVQSGQPLARVCKENGNLVLVINNEKDQESKKLRGIWNSILEKKELSLPTGGRDIIEGKEVIWHGEKIITKKDKDYIWAIFSTLEMEYNYNLEYVDFEQVVPKAKIE